MRLGLAGARRSTGVGEGVSEDKLAVLVEVVCFLRAITGSTVGTQALLACDGLPVRRRPPTPAALGHARLPTPGPQTSHCPWNLGCCEGAGANAGARAAGAGPRGLLGRPPARGGRPRLRLAALHLRWPWRRRPPARGCGPAASPGPSRRVYARRSRPFFDTSPTGRPAAAAAGAGGAFAGARRCADWLAARRRPQVPGRSRRRSACYYPEIVGLFALPPPTQPRARPRQAHTAPPAQERTINLLVLFGRGDEGVRQRLAEPAVLGAVLGR
jgi:hypothetical protein